MSAVSPTIQPRPISSSFSAAGTHNGTAAHLSALGGAITTSASSITDSQQQAQQQIVASIAMSEILASQDAYKEMVRASKEFRKAMRGMSKHARVFAQSLENFASAAEASADLESVYAIRKYAAMQSEFAEGNDTLCSLYDSQFETPLRANYTNHKENVKFAAEKYKRSKEQHARQMKVLEKEEARATRAVRSDLSAFQGTLRELSRMATSLESVKNDHFDAVVEEERRNAAFVAERCGDWIALESSTLWTSVAAIGEDAVRALDGETEFVVPLAASAAADDQQQHEDTDRDLLHHGLSSMSRRSSGGGGAHTMRPLSTLTRPQASPYSGTTGAVPASAASVLPRGTSTIARGAAFSPAAASAASDHANKIHVSFGESLVHDVDLRAAAATAASAESAAAAEH
ncbi:hypothetical protein BC828DRAFT_410047 [Blastocladiella britannica]|nr:hypothetical protein BC828DRAFT_410047 [Blastocladiella britannica]